ncbi:MAG: spore germination protein [Syntrophomonadaceae bacterium]|jgi:spore germination protein|nr:spore germination protein [Syntrophomonadaceae bacterium]
MFRIPKKPHRKPFPTGQKQHQKTVPGMADQVSGSIAQPQTKSNDIFPGGGTGEGTSLEKRQPLSTSLAENLAAIRNRTGENSDLIIREFEVFLYKIRAAVIYLDGLVNNELVHVHVLRGLMAGSAAMRVSEQEEAPECGEMRGTQEVCLQGEDAFKAIKDKLLSVAGAGEISTVDQAVLAFHSADAVFLLDGYSQGLVLAVRGFPVRGIAEPGTENMIRGPREGFVEGLRINTALLRRRLRDPNFKMISMRLGRRTHTDCVLAYVQDLVDPDLLSEVQQRLANIDCDLILESGNIEQLIEDSWLSPFPQVQSTERPDKVIAAVLEGRVAILVDGTPFALLVPATFLQFFQAGEDYYERWLIASVVRMLRIFASYVATFTPALYVAVLSFHPGLLPTNLALAVAATREGIPFPAVVEALIMEVAFELFREAGARLPGPIGQTVGIVGGLIVGEAAVAANLASPGMVIVVALTALAGFSIPAYNMAIGFRLVRFPLTILAATLGLYGVMLGFIIINIHMVSLRSFGVTYLSPLAPYRFRDWKDILIRAPARAMVTRPAITRARQPKRENSDKPEGW